MSTVMSNVNPFRRPLSPIQALLLVQLEREPKYGYEMFKAIKNEFKGSWDPKTGSIYPALRGLERKGYVRTKIEDDVEFYHITEKGRKLLRTVGEHMKISMRFTSKYLSVISKWMSPRLKEHILGMLGEINHGDMDMNTGLLNLLDDNIDKKIKLSVLRKIERSMEKRLDVIRCLIDRLEDDS